MTLQEILKQRQAADLVGRNGRLTEFRTNLRLPGNDDGRRFLFNIHGVAGVGKTFLAQGFQRIAEDEGAVCAYVNERAFDVVETMAALTADLAKKGHDLKDFSWHLSRYRARRHELEAELGVSGGFPAESVLHLGVATTGLATGDVAASTDTAEHVERLRAYVRKKARSSEEVRLLLSPTEVLSRPFVTEIARLASRYPVALTFDTFEQTAPFLESWLLDVLIGSYGPIPANMVITVAGQRPLNANRWSSFRTITADVPLEPFTEAEARELLDARGVRDEKVVRVILTLSGRLPMWLATLADSRPTDAEEVTDPSDSAVERFLKWEPDENRRAFALAGALPRSLNEDVLSAVWTDASGIDVLFDWLCKLPFVSEAPNGWRYHEVARAPMLRLGRDRSPQRWRDQHRKLATYYAAERSIIERSDVPKWSDPAWLKCRIEETYHLLCADRSALRGTLDDAVHAVSDSTATARRWAAMLTEAGQDAGVESVQRWGERLADTMLKDNADGVEFATALLDDANLTSSTRKEAFRVRARLLRTSGQLERALTDFDKSIELDQAFQAALAGRGETFRLMGQFDRALEDFNEAIKLDPEDDWSFLSRGQVHHAKGQFAEAIADFDRAIELDAKFILAFFERANAYRAMGRFDEALADFDRAIELGPQFGWVFIERANAYRAMGRFDEALADFDRAIEVNPEYDWVFIERANAYRAMGRFDEALADFDRAIELDPQFGWAFAVRGRTYREMGRFDEALADFDRAIELDPQFGWAFAVRGRTYREMGRFDEALADFDRAIEVNPEHDWAFSERGQTYRVMGRFDEALADFDRAIELDPQFGWALSERGRTYRVMGRFDEALADFDRAIELEPSGINSFIAYLRALVSAMQGDRRGWFDHLRIAVRGVQREIVDHPGVRQHQLNLALYLAAQGEGTSARDALTETLNWSPNSDADWDALDDLTELADIPGIDKDLITDLIALVEASLRA